MKKIKKFMSYYKPYKKLFFADMFFALLASIISLIYPLIVRYITNDLLINYSISEGQQNNFINICNDRTCYFRIPK